ncbi:MAG: hypothetical protein A2086_02335 [Spirochaetes bacterium GWD1_27_9]|nr:MAG: hypothetical protein A2Z98_03325 [Spirochaetes bacterium GWB1_27_13]OHD24691.1 MAG: hypothetical protein A2Y34_10770 [Spirochaetes bacterium GWC1_27_15]OHD30414.1 MAG: hypothetical protein A2086_02335 [Spirochaetes bacterium GWD1_27_9]
MLYNFVVGKITEKRTKEKLDVLKMNDKERAEYENYLENLSYQKSVFETARFEGKLDGKVEGKQQTLIRLLSKRFGVADAEKQLITHSTLKIYLTHQTLTNLKLFCIFIIIIIVMLTIIYVR